MRGFLNQKVEFCRIQVYIIFAKTAAFFVIFGKKVVYPVDLWGNKAICAELCQQKIWIISCFFALLPYLRYAKLLLQ